MCFNFEPTARKCRVCGEDAKPISGISKPADLCLSHFTAIARTEHRDAKIAAGLNRDIFIMDESGSPIGIAESKVLAVTGPGGDFKKFITE